MEIVKRLQENFNPTWKKRSMLVPLIYKQKQMKKNFREKTDCDN